MLCNAVTITVFFTSILALTSAALGASSCGDDSTVTCCARYEDADELSEEFFQQLDASPGPHVPADELGNLSGVGCVPTDARNECPYPQQACCERVFDGGFVATNCTFIDGR